MKLYSEKRVLQKLFLFGIPFGLALSLVGLVVLNTNLVAEEYRSIFKSIYASTCAFGFLFIFTKSTFINLKFNLVYKKIGVIFFIILTINLLREFDVVKIESLKITSYLLISSLYVLYLNFFLKKIAKVALDYVKIGLLSIIFLVGFFSLLDLAPNFIKHVTSACFWSVIILMVLTKNRKTRANAA
jgi:hypothetical protein